MLLRGSLLLLGLSGCMTSVCVEEDDGTIHELDDGSVPDIALTPRRIEFGSVEVSDELEQVEILTIENHGDANLHVERFEVAHADTPIAVRSIQPLVVRPQDATEIELVYDPVTASEDQTRLHVHSDDPDEPTCQVLLTGTGIAPVLEVDPLSHDFGTVTVGCESRLAVTLTNAGNAELIVYEASYDTVGTELAFWATDDGAGLLELGPQESAQASVTHRPLDELDDIATLAIASNDPLDPEVQASQIGAGVYLGTTLDSFEQPTEVATDIIFAVDKSGSMEEDLSLVIDNFGVFVTAMASMEADFHVAVTQADDGCINGSHVWIDDSFTASEAESTVETMMNMSGAYASNTERAFMLLAACLAETGTGGCNEGLIRDDASLHLVCVSDEPEQSVNDWAYYQALFQSYKEHPGDVVVHGVGGDNPSGCDSNSAYTGVWEATVATGGLFLSICAKDWASHLVALAEASTAGVKSYYLGVEPVPDTIVVVIDGLTSTQGWSYEERTNAIVFDSGHVPQAGAIIEVEYAIAGGC